MCVLGVLLQAEYINIGTGKNPEYMLKPDPDAPNLKEWTCYRESCEQVRLYKCKCVGSVCAQSRLTFDPCLAFLDQPPPRRKMQEVRLLAPDFEQCQLDSLKPCARLEVLRAWHRNQHWGQR